MKKIIIIAIFLFIGTQVNATVLPIECTDTQRDKPSLILPVSTISSSSCREEALKPFFIKIGEKRDYIFTERTYLNLTSIFISIFLLLFILRLKNK